MLIYTSIALLGLLVVCDVLKMFKLFDEASLHCRLLCPRVCIKCGFLTIHLLFSLYRKQGNICWAKLSWFLQFLRVPQKFSREYLAIVE